MPSTHWGKIRPSDPLSLENSIRFLLENFLGLFCKAHILQHTRQHWGFPGGTVVESPPADAGDMGSCPGP